MLRRAPTSISLSNRDVAEHFEHFERRKSQGQEKNGPKKSSRTLVEQAPCEPIDLLAVQMTENAENKVTVYEYGGANQQRVLQRNALPFVYRPQHAEDTSPEDIPLDDLSLTLQGVEPCSDSDTDESIDHVRPSDSSGSLEELPIARLEDSLQQSSLTPRNTFDYGGFVEASADNSTSFLPQDLFTPGNIEVPGVPGLRLRIPLPRSPLYRAQSADSPERNLTTSLTPRIPYGTPGMLLSQPARRPRTYRPRSVSYSFAESERASTTYEHFEGSDNDLIAGQIDSEAQKYLHEDVEMRFSQSASVESIFRQSSPPDPIEISGPGTIQGVPAAEKNQWAQSLSPQLPLPPPFSAVRRDVSLAASLPSVHRDVGQSRSPTPLDHLAQLQASPIAGSPASSSNGGDSEPGSRRILRDLAALPLRLLSAYRSRSPFRPRFDGSGSEPSTPRSPIHGPDQTPATNTRSYHFQIYDDSLPATAQPQTPQHLPEARHQSRFHPSYTAPASGRMESPRTSRSELSRRRGTRSDSPTGIATPGFQGLYGGRENIDDAVMFDRASQRLWTLSVARRQGRRSMSNTPDREPSFADIQEDIR